MDAEVSRGSDRWNSCDCFLEPWATWEQSQNFITLPQDAEDTVGHHNVTRWKRMELV